MRIVAIFTALMLMAAGTARAQTYQQQDDSHRVLKVLIGAGALVTGTVVAAKSSKTTTVSGTLGNTETSEFSTSQLITGLAVAGTGGFLLWDGLRDHGPARPSTSVGVAVGKARGLFIRRSW